MLKYNNALQYYNIGFSVVDNELQKKKNNPTTSSDLESVTVVLVSQNFKKGCMYKRVILNLKTMRNHYL